VPFESVKVWRLLNPFESVNIIEFISNRAARHCASRARMLAPHHSCLALALCLPHLADDHRAPLPPGPPVSCPHVSHMRPSPPLFVARSRRAREPPAAIIAAHSHRVRVILVHNADPPCAHTDPLLLSLCGLGASCPPFPSPFHRVCPLVLRSRRRP
jgi:hypothetical protein